MSNLSIHQSVAEHTEEEMLSRLALQSTLIPVVVVYMLESQTQNMLFTLKMFENYSYCHSNVCLLVNFCYTYTCYLIEPS